MSTTATTKRRVLPIRFKKLNVGSKFRIFAEPTRVPPVRHSTDNAVYHKECEAFSVDTADETRAIILYPDDLVIPLTRGKQA